VADATLPTLDVTGLRISAPVARPTAIICIGQNYAAHAAESGDEPPTIPIVFLKHPNTLRGAYERRTGPVEGRADRLGGRAGRRHRRRSPLPAVEEQSLACIAGYAVSNDVSEREFQTTLAGGRWSKGKCCEDFQPLGPWLAVDEVAEPQKLGLRSRVNGEPRQNSNTSDMIFTVAFLIQHLSQFTVLSPGDVINTGTPQESPCRAVSPTSRWAT